MESKVDIFGVRIDDVTLDQAILVIDDWLKNNQKHFVVTPNPEFVIAAQKDQQFKEILNKADLAIPDGAGLKLTGRIHHTISGTDLMEQLIVLANEKGYSIGLVGGVGGIAQKLSNRLSKRFPKLKIGFVDDGPKVDNNGQEYTSETTQPYHQLVKPCDILFVAFGQIKQEKWIDRNLDKLPVKVVMGVGGAFDYLSGSVIRAPKFIRNLGLEWLFRLIIQPWRIKRQLIGAQFFIKVLFNH